MQVAITGATGFVGSSIVKGLSDSFNFKVLPSLNLNDEAFVGESLPNVSTFIHLAGVSSVGDCEKNLSETYKSNVGLTCYLAEVYFRLNRGGHFIFTSTGQIYDETESEPQNENTRLAPINTYARSKLCAEVALAELARYYGCSLTILRMYNHTHKSQSTRFILPSIMRQIEEAQTDVVKIKVGNIDIDRDFSAIQDLVVAFDRLLNFNIEVPRVETYNLSSGVGKSLRQIILGLAERLGRKVEFEVDPMRIRPGEPTRVVGDSTKFQQHFGWASRSTSISSFLDLFLEER